VSTKNKNSVKSKQSPTWFSDTKESFMEVIKNNGTLFTVFAVTLILISGVSIIDSPSNWWVSAVSIAVFFATIFLFINARVILKTVISVVMTILLAAYAFNVGSNIDLSGPGGIVWMLSALFLFFATLAISYILPSGKSRWGSITLAQLIFFSLTFALSIGFNHVQIATAVSLVVSIAVFVYSYRFTRASRESKKHFPENQLTEDFVKKIEYAAADAGFEVIDRREDETNTGSVIVWGETKAKASRKSNKTEPEKRAYMLYPVMMHSSFTPIGRKMKKLGYRDKNINPWLINIAFKEIPSWQSRGAEIIPILIDLRNGNGHEAKTIGVQLPDTKRVMPFGVFPGKIFTDKDVSTAKLSKALLSIDEEYSEYSGALQLKHEKALERMSLKEEVDVKEISKDEEKED